MGKVTLDEVSLEFSESQDGLGWKGPSAHPIMSVLLTPTLCFLLLVFRCRAKPGALGSANY